MKLLQTFLAGTALVMASGAVAQTAPQDTAPQDMAPGQEYETTTEAPAEATTPIDEMAETSAQDASFSDAEIESFAAAALKIQALEGDPATKNEQVMEVVSESGIDVETFNAISVAMQSDPELAERVQVAAREIQQSAG